MRFKASLRSAWALVLSSGADHPISWLVLHTQMIHGATASPDWGGSDMLTAQRQIEDDRRSYHN